MKLLLEQWREFVKQEVEEFLPHGEVRAVKKIGSSTLSPEEQAEQDLEKYGYVRDEDERDFDIEVQIAGVSNEDVEEWAFSEEAEELESSYNYDVQLRIVENWRGYLREEQGSSVIAHLVGQAGSGKTYFIENTLRKKYPEIVAMDLDDFDDEADAVVGGDKSWRQSGDPSQVDQKLARRHFDKVQSLLDQFISENSDKKIFLAGMSVFPWVQGNNELDVGNPQMKIYLNRGTPEEVAKDRIKRDVKKGLYRDEKPTQEDLQRDIKVAKEEKAQLLSAGYKSATPEEIVKAVDAIMQGEPDETPT